MSEIAEKKVRKVNFTIAALVSPFFLEESDRLAVLLLVQLFHDLL